MNDQKLKPAPLARSAFAHFVPITTRWMDNDVYGHLNNVVYFSFFDTAVNQFLVERDVLDFEYGPTIGLVVHSECNYFKPLAFPEKVEAGLRISRLGRSSVQYQIGLFASGAERTAAWGHFVHVYVDRRTRHPQPLPPQLRRALAALESAAPTLDG